jgi:XRE family transcriptional regulator, regulator of sulfur utilization
MNLIVANNFKQIRDRKKLSLDKVAELTGVSKSMLGQIERGESNPTITTVWKIANGLKIAFTELINTPKSDIVIVNKEEIKPLIEDNEKYRLYPLFPYEEGRRFEIYSIDIEPGGQLSAEGHPDGTEEFLTIYQGEITVSVNIEEYTIHKGDSIRFKADRPHGYRNSGNELAVINMVIHYQI